MKSKTYFLIFILCSLFALPLAAQEKQIAYIESNKNWHYLYDAQGKKIAGYSRSSVGDVVGWEALSSLGRTRAGTASTT